ncbi:hemolysin XhlA family protein [Paenibacillus sp. RC84]|uniref:hemolysin XhlA family protein n=1 Tax=Paenibacillus sp. RC84 TaxID=3156252 RepID=UPI003511C8F8
MKDIQETMTNVRLDIRELSTKVDGLKDVSRKIDEVEDSAWRKIDEVEEVAKAALDNARYAHTRLDKIDKLTTWLATTVIGAIILAIMGYLIRGGFNLPK